jgi:hypothetical protein
MSKTNPRFSPFVYFYVGLFFTLAGLLPVWAVFATGLGTLLPTPYRIASLLWPAVIAGSFWYASKRCSSERLRYRDGLLWVAASMIAGTMYMSFLLVLPLLLVVFSSSVLIALYGDIRRKPGYAPEKWSRVIHYFYRNRMVQ